MTNHYQHPFDQFNSWYEEASRHKDILDASAVNLATASADGAPSSRMVLLKGYDRDGFVIYTNLKSRKAQELDKNSRAALCFYWPPLGRQIRIEGTVSLVSDTEADQYFAARPLKSRIAACASRQSQPLESRAALIKNVAQQTARFAVGDTGRPAFWSGFRIAPRRMEFWTNGEYRLHDRTVYLQDGKGKWRHHLLYP